MQGRMANKSNDADYKYLDKLIPRDHFLKKINNLIDFSFIGVLALRDRHLLLTQYVPS